MNQEEKTLRSNIRDLIRFVKQKKTKETTLFEHNIIRIAELELKKMLSEVSTPDVSPTPNKSTGINVLEELLKKIVPVLETDYKSLTTNETQRESFRSHIVNAVVKTLTPAIANNSAEEDTDTGDELNEVEIDVVDDPVDDKFIDIRTDAEKKAEEEEEQPDEREDFASGTEGDETGRNMAYQSF
jgi:Ran GTPase-activating protein (RanGAP) involved in mRNA processing and transport